MQYEIARSAEVVESYGSLAVGKVKIKSIANSARRGAWLICCFCIGGSKFDEEEYLE